MRTVAVSSSSGGYGVTLGQGLLARLPVLLREIFPDPSLSRVGIVSNPVVWDLYGKKILALIEAGGVSPVVSLHPDGESHKTLTSLEGLLTDFLSQGWERREPLLAVGGGVTGDMGGLASALLLRGVPLIHIPTTVVAQVDSSIGGKTGIDHPLGKNLIGSFTAPAGVLTDPHFLATLPLRERRAGLGEVLKYAFIGDMDLLSFLDREIESLAGERFDVDLWEQAVLLCAGDKARIVSADEKESGERMLLNFGHTFGHALEAASGFSGILHGEGVGLGMLSAASIAVAEGRTTPGTFDAMKELVHRAGLPTAWPSGVTFAAIVPYLSRDKKARGRRVALILPSSPGSVQIVRDYDPALLASGVFR